MPRRYTLTLTLALAGLAVAAAGCAQGPLTEDDVAEARTLYAVELKGFVVQEDPMAAAVPAPAAEDAEAEDAAGEDAEAAADVEGEDEDAAAAAGTAEPPAAPATGDVILDLLIRRTGGGDRLPGVTVDVEQVDAREQPKATYRVWVDTSELGGKGATTQVTQRLEDVEVAPDDKFAVQIREEVPPDMRSEYREFAEAPSP